MFTGLLRKVKKMTGDNELRLCSEEMIAAMQIYIDRLIPVSKAIVQSVEQNVANRDEFIIKLSNED